MWANAFLLHLDDPQLWNDASRLQSLPACYSKRVCEHDRQHRGHEQTHLSTPSRGAGGGGALKLTPGRPGEARAGAASLSSWAVLSHFPFWRLITVIGLLLELWSQLRHGNERKTKGAALTVAAGLLPGSWCSTEMRKEAHSLLPALLSPLSLPEMSCTKRLSLFKALKELNYIQEAHT